MVHSHYYRDIDSKEVARKQVRKQASKQGRNRQLSAKSIAFATETWYYLLRKEREKADGFTANGYRNTTALR
jgi:hypothetical protein